MQYLKKNHCKGELDACPQSRPISIVMSVFFLATFIILSMVITVPAQSQFLQERLTQLEENLASDLASYPGKNDLQKKGSESMLARYMRDGCIQSLCGNWRWDPSGDIVRITYNEKAGAFEGRVIRPVKLGYNPGHLLFVVDLAHNSMERLYNEAFSYRLQSTYVFTLDQYVEFLRAKKNCKYWHFEGTEYSFDKTKQKTTMKLRLVLTNDRLRYGIEARGVWHLARIR